MAGSEKKAGDAKQEAGELVGLLKAYVLQETVGPLKKAARTLAVGSASAVLGGLAAVMFLIGLLRLLQGETGTVFSGQWNWVPYVLTALAAFFILGIAGGIVLRKAR
jgi:H+/Cl- antiporter ClcA